MNTKKVGAEAQANKKKSVYPRQGWKQRIQEALQTHDNETINTEWLNAPLTNDSYWEWENLS